MGFTVRFLLGTVLVLLCSSSTQTAELNRQIRQVNDGANEATEKTQAETKIQQSVVANLSEKFSNKPKTDVSIEDSTTNDKQNNIAIRKTEPYEKAQTQLENARSIDIRKYLSNDFHNKNNVYTLPISPDTEKYIDPDFAYSATARMHVDRNNDYAIHSELTTPKTSLFDQRYKEAVESVGQKLEHIDDFHEELLESESKDVNLEELLEETKRNDTKADLDYTNYKNIIGNSTGDKNSVHKDLVVEAGTNLDFRSAYNETTIIDEDGSGNNTIVKEPDEEKKIEVSTLSNIIPVKGDLEHAESVTSKSVTLTTRKSIVVTKPPSTKNASHISILSNKIETETVKAIIPESIISTTTAKSKGDVERVPDAFSKKTPIDVSKRLFTITNTSTDQADTNYINKKSEQLQQENQVIPVHVEPPQPTEAAIVKKINQTKEIVPNSIESVREEKNRSTPNILETVPKTNIRVEESAEKEAKSQTTPKNVEIVTIERKSETTTLPVATTGIVTTTSAKINHSVDSIEATTKSKMQATTLTMPATTMAMPATTVAMPTTTEAIPATTMTIPATTMTIPATTMTMPATTVTMPATTITMPATTKTMPATTVAMSETTVPFSPEIAEFSTFETQTVTTTTSKEVEIVTSVVTETSVSPWEKVTVATTEVQKTTEPTATTTTTTKPTTIEPETERPTEESETTAFLADSTAAPTAINTRTDEATTLETETTTEASSEMVKNFTITTENVVRTSKEMVFKETTTSGTTIAEVETTEIPTTEAATTEVPEVTTLPPESTQAPVVTIAKINRSNIEVEVTTANIPVTNSARLIPDIRAEDVTEALDPEISTDNITMTSEHTDPPEDNSGMIAAITISSIGAVCLILLAALLVIMRKRQKRFNYGQRCTPLSLDDYSMDNVSVYNSVRRKGLRRSSKRSYGNPAFEDPSSVSHPLNFPSLGKFANNLEDIRAEFEEIPQITARINELPEGCDTKNRYANVIPLPETRVFLSMIEGQANSDYINANYVTGPKNTKGYYIACQAPMQNTVDDFWRMIWEQQTKVILMLTHLFENAVEKCVDYLPPSEVLDCHRLFGDFQVTLKKREVKDKYIISSLQLKNMVSNSWREVTHFWYLGWPEKGVPSEANSLIAFLIEARSYMKSSSLDRKEVNNGSLTNGMPKNELNPVVVHCSPGTGRTGVVIACDIAIREFEQTRLVDVPRIVYKIRRDRASAVQTKEQYAFIYKVINLYATKLTGGALDSL